MSDDGAVVFGLFLGLIIAFLITWLVCDSNYTSGQGTETQQFATVCDYENGYVQGDVCIRDGKVLNFNTESKTAN